MTTNPIAKRGLLHAASAALAVGQLVVAVAGCSRPDTQRDTPAPSAPAVSSPIANANATAKSRTTDPEIALGNLDAQIASAEKLAAGGDAPRARALVDLLLSRAQFLSRFSDWDRVDALTAKLVAESPKSGDAHLARATFLETVHRFDAALAELDDPTHGVTDAAARSKRAAIYLAQGRLDEAAALHAWSEDATLAMPLTSAAMLAGSMGRDADALRLFDKAAASYRDVSPFPVAWMSFTRATYLENKGDRAGARSGFTQALAALPRYTHAAVHLAALETPKDAIALLAPLAGKTEDADVDAALGDALHRAGEPGAAEATARARASYERLLAKWPEAFADHAAAFYLGSGADPTRALDLATKNARARKTDKAIDLWLTAALAAKSHPAACEAAHAGQALRYKSTELDALIASGLAGCSTEK